MSKGKKIIRIILAIILSLVLCFICFTLVTKVVKGTKIKRESTKAEEGMKEAKEIINKKGNLNYVLYVYNDEGKKLYLYDLMGKKLKEEKIDLVGTEGNDLRVVNNGEELSFKTQDKKLIYNGEKVISALGSNFYENSKTGIRVSQENGIIKVSTREKDYQYEVVTNLLGVFENDNSLFLLTDFGKELKSSALISINKMDGKASGVIDLLMENPRVVSITKDIVYIEGEGILKEFDPIERVISKVYNLPANKDVAFTEDGCYLKDKSNDKVYFITKDKVNSALSAFNEEDAKGSFKVERGATFGALVK